jgi:hypothetical protein
MGSIVAKRGRPGIANREGAIAFRDALAPRPDPR